MPLVLPMHNARNAHPLESSLLVEPSHPLLRNQKYPRILTSLFQPDDVRLEKAGRDTFVSVLWRNTDGMDANRGSGLYVGGHGDMRKSRGGGESGADVADQDAWRPREVGTQEKLTCLGLTVSS